MFQIYKYIFFFLKIDDFRRFSGGALVAIFGILEKTCTRGAKRELLATILKHFSGVFEKSEKSAKISNNQQQSANISKTQQQNSKHPQKTEKLTSSLCICGCALIPSPFSSHNKAVQWNSGILS